MSTFIKTETTLKSSDYHFNLFRDTKSFISSKINNLTNTISYPFKKNKAAILGGSDTLPPIFASTSNVQRLHASSSFMREKKPEHSPMLRDFDEISANKSSATPSAPNNCNPTGITAAVPAENEFNSLEARDESDWGLRKLFSESPEIEEVESAVGTAGITADTPTVSKIQDCLSTGNFAHSVTKTVRFQEQRTERTYDTSGKRGGLSPPEYTPAFIDPKPEEHKRNLSLAQKIENVEEDIECCQDYLQINPDNQTYKDKLQASKRRLQYLRKVKEKIESLARSE